MINVIILILIVGYSIYLIGRAVKNTKEGKGLGCSCCGGGCGACSGCGSAKEFHPEERKNDQSMEN